MPYDKIVVAADDENTGFRVWIRKPFISIAQVHRDAGAWENHGSVNFLPSEGRSVIKAITEAIAIAEAQR